MKKLLLIFTLILTSSTPAQASTGWRYWGYFQSAPGASSWSYALTGPTTNVADGSVEGWAFTFSGDAVPDAATPKIAPNFTSICAGTKSVVGKKRVGVIIDFGPASLRPQGEKLPHSLSKCVVIEKNATGMEILGSIAKLRTSSSGYICGINSYPAKECGTEVKTPRTLLKK